MNIRYFNPIRLTNPFRRWHIYLREAGKINHGEAEHGGSEELEGDGLGTDPLVAARHPARLTGDLVPHLVPVSVDLDKKDKRNKQKERRKKW